jgi:anthranilate synthase/aminodeoxychorismate synthase-like glutamine amidotransferase|uniref:anthranilate synthase component II n=1 Tax=Polynucleobacter sp. TaxID=2029855 RepID=UPI004047CFC2
MSRRVTVIDAYDSFVHILVGYLEQLDCIVRIYRKDDVALYDAISQNNCDMILLGPGPGHPAESGYETILERNAGALPVFGVCLGHQAIGLYYGCRINYAKNLMHGKVSVILNDGFGCFSSFQSNAFMGMRYHSLIVSDEMFPSQMTITARSNGDNYVMGIRHKKLPIEGIQFHPESIGTESGIDILRNFMNAYIQRR